jgi:hypothetical protein
LGFSEEILKISTQWGKNEEENILIVLLLFSFARIYWHGGSTLGSLVGLERALRSSSLKISRV